MFLLSSPYLKEYTATVKLMLQSQLQDFDDYNVFFFNVIILTLYQTYDDKLMPILSPCKKNLFSQTP